MIQTSPTMRILVAVSPVDFRKGIDGLAGICRQQLQRDPMNGWAFVFRNRRGTAVKILLYDGQGFWLCQKRLEAGTFEMLRPEGEAATVEIDATELAMLLSGVSLASVKRRKRYSRAG
jgi:transposase